MIQQSRKITQLDFSLIDGRVSRTLETPSNDNKSYGFLLLCLELLFPRADEEYSSMVTDGGNDRGADAIYIREDSGTAHVAIVQCKYARSVKGAEKNFPGSEIDKLLSLIRDIADRTDSLQTSVNPILFEKINDVWRLVDKGLSIQFQIFLVSNTMPLVNLERKRLSAFCQQYSMVSFEEVPFWTVADLISSEVRPNSDGSLNCIDLQKFERIDCDIRGLIANVDALSFIEMITTEDNSAIRRHLFDENIRGYLGLEGGFNRQIRASALSDDNHLFWYLNNGITIIAKDFSHQPIRGSKLKISDFQIVNGAQTSYSLFSAFQGNPDQLSKVVLLVKVFASSRDDISERIAIATNSQARIAPRDLKANDRIQKKIGSSFLDAGIFYERKKNQYMEQKGSTKIDSLKLGQAIVAYYLEEPHLAKTGSDEIFGNLYSRVFSENLDANFLIELATLYLHVSAFRDEQLINLRSGMPSGEEHEFIGYTQWHLLYCIRLLAKGQNKEIPEEREYEDYLSRALSVIRKIAEDHHSQSFYRVFRSARTKDLIHKEMGIGQLQFDF